jgi:WD40 repeat protein
VCALPGPDPNGPSLLATTGADGTVRIWNPATGLPVGEPLAESPDTLGGLTLCTTSSADCIGVTGDGGLRTWTAATASLATLPSSQRASAVAMPIGLDSDVLITGDIAGLVHVTDMATGRILRPPVRTGNGAVLALCSVSDQPTRVAAAGHDGTITVFTMTADQDPERIFHAHNGPVRDLCLVERPGDSPLLASAGNDATIRVWDSATWMPHGGPLKGHDGWIWSIAPIPVQARQAPRLASAGADSTVRLWDLFSGEQTRQPLVGHTDQVCAVTCATAADGRFLLISGGHDGTVRLWDSSTGRLVHTIPLRIPVQSLLQQKPDGRSLNRTSGGATITVGLRAGILALDLHSSLFPTLHKARS